MSKTIGFIGCGNMGSAIIEGIVNSGLESPKDIIVGDINEKSLNTMKENIGVNITTNNLEVAKMADILFLSIKPNLYSLIIDQIKDSIRDETVIVTIAAGKSIKSTQDSFKKNVKVIRTMPNTPALVSEGMAALCPSKEVSEEDLNYVVKIFESFGKAEIINEELFDAVTSVSGSSPAYVYMLIEAMGDAAVLDGMRIDQAYKFASQAVLGSAKMVLETGKHPAELRNMVCSPRGTTIEAVTTLEEKGFRNAVISAMKACTEKSIDMTE